VKTITLIVSEELLRSCEGLLSKHLAVNGSCTNDLERLAFLVLVAEKESKEKGPSGLGLEGTKEI
jgi:hypothetical protein